MKVLGPHLENVIIQKEFDTFYTNSRSKYCQHVVATDLFGKYFCCGAFLHFEHFTGCVTDVQAKTY